MAQPIRSNGSEAIVDHLADFVQYLRCGVGSSDRTVEGYGRDLEFLCRDLSATKGREAQLGDLEHCTLQGWICDLTDKQHLSVATVRRRKAAVVRLCRWARLERLIPEVPTELVCPKVEPPLPQWLELDLTERLVADPLRERESWPLKAVRNYAMLNLLAEGGMRANEGATLRMDCLRMDIGHPGVMLVKVLGKGKKEREIPVRRSVEPVQHYLAMRDQHKGGCGDKDRVFLSLTGEGPLSRGAVSSLVRDHARRAGIKAHAHLLRHTAATLMLLNGAELRAVQEFLGHKDPRTTARYAHVTLAHIVERALNHHPFSRPQEKGQTLEARLDELLQIARQLLVWARPAGAPPAAGHLDLGGLKKAA